MSENFTGGVKMDENPDGTVSFATEVVATIAGLAANEVEGVASMSSQSAGITDILTRKSSKNLTKGVRIDLQDNMVTADISIVVEYGSPIPDVAKNIQENVKKAIETMSGLDVKSVDVHVTGMSFEKEHQAVAELNEQHKKMIEETAPAEEAPSQEPKEEPEAGEIEEEDDTEAEESKPEE